MVDEGRVSRLLRDITDRIARVRAAAETPDNERSELWLDGVKYLFVTAIEGCIDVAQHIASSERYRAPDTNSAAVRLLAEHGVVESATSEAVARAVGFRNVLVHRYIDVDDQRVVDAIDQLADLDAFVSEVSAWMLTQGD